jgi:hypothetical protein
VFYRGLDLSNIDIDKSWELKIVFVWRLVALKWVADLIEAYKISGLKNELIIIWDWEEKNILEKSSVWFNINFLWYKDREFVINYLSKNNFVLVNPSYQEWMPTTVIEWLATWCVVIASDVWWTIEITKKGDLILFDSWDVVDLVENLLKWVKEYEKLKWLSLDDINEKFNREVNILKFYELVK